MSESPGLFELLAWVEENKKRLIIGAVTLAVVGSGIAIYRWKQDQTELAASDALLELRLPLNAPPNAKPPAADQFQKVASTFPGTTAAQRALLLAAGALFTEGKYDEAKAQFENFLQRYGDNPFAASAAYGKAASLDAQGKSDEALRAYQDVLARYPKAPMIDEARLAMARLYESKQQPQLALQTYEEMTRTNLMSSKSTEALTRKESLLAKHPELAKTSAPLATPTIGLPTPSTNASHSATSVVTNSASSSATNAPAAAGTNASSSKAATPPKAPDKKP